MLLLRYYICEGMMEGCQSTNFYLVLKVCCRKRVPCADNKENGTSD